MTDRIEARSQLDDLLVELRPELHRYCARMVGSAFDGEDVVQDALIKATGAWPSGGPDNPRSWIFRIAHNTALDALRHRRRQAALKVQAARHALEGGEMSDARVAVAANFATLMALTPAQRSCVVLVDVLGHSLQETCEVLAVTAPAAKAALHRGRLRLRELAAQDAPTPSLAPGQLDRLRDYARRFNDRDFDALRTLLAEDVRLDLPNRTRLSGRGDVGVYFTRYDQASYPWRMTVGLADGRAAVLVSDPSDPPGTARWVVLLDWKDGQIAAIRDFFYARYAMEGVTISAL